MSKQKSGRAPVKNAPLLSVGIIFKNEIRCLERCLQSLEPLRAAMPTQLVMGDTGSTDGSRAIAEKYADVLVDFPWNGSFADARNAVLERCSGTWYLAVDCDEWVEAEFAPLLAAFFASRQARPVEHVEIIQRNYLSLTFRENYSDHLVPRLARRAGLHYKGRIHETFCFAENGVEREVPHDQLPQLILHHDGYAAENDEVCRARAARNLPPLLEQMERTPNDLRCWLEIVQCCYDPKEGLKYGQQALAALPDAAARQQELFGARLYQHVMMRAGACGAWETLLTLLNEAEERFPQALAVRLDGNAFAIDAAYDARQYKTALDHGEAYWAAVAEYDRNSAAMERARDYDGLYRAVPLWRAETGASLFFSACAVEEWARAEQELDRLQALAPLRLSRLAEMERTLAAALRSTALLRADRKSDRQGAALCRLFAEVERELTARLYTPEALREENLPLLPPIRRFGRRLAQALEALEAGAEREYLRLLREAAEDVPEMKNAALFLLDHMDALRPTPPELAALAEQVKAILSQYPPDDPAVAELKASPAYQKVAWLIE